MYVSHTLREGRGEENLDLEVTMERQSASQNLTKASDLYDIQEKPSTAVIES